MPCGLCGVLGYIFEMKSLVSYANEHWESIPKLIFAYNRPALVFCTFLTISLDDAKNLK